MKNTSKNIAFLSGFLTLMLSTGCASIVENKTAVDTDDSLENKVDPDVYIREGDKAAADGNFDKALVQYVIALEEDDTNAELYYKVGFIHQSEGRMDLAERSFRGAVRNSPNHVPARVSLGLIALRKENYQYAELVLHEVLEQDPSNWRALNALGVLSDLQEDFSSSREFYDRALAQTPESVDVLNNLGYSLYLQGKWNEAETTFKQVVDKNPEYSQGWSNLALVYLQLGENDRAKIAFQKIVNEHQALNNIGYFNMLRNDMVSARKQLQGAARAAPFYYALAYRNLASVEASQTHSFETIPERETTTVQSRRDVSRLRISPGNPRSRNEFANSHAVRDDELLRVVPEQ